MVGPSSPNTNYINTVDTRALRRFGVGSALEQTVLFGYDYPRLEQRATSYYLFGVSDLDAYSPVYGQTAIPAGAPYLNNNSILNQRGLYAQDQIKTRQHLVIAARGRQDFAQNTIADFLASSGGSSRADDKFTGRVGVTYLTDAGATRTLRTPRAFCPTQGRTSMTPQQELRTSRRCPRMRGRSRLV